VKIDRIDLPSGGWVEFADPSDMSGADYRRLQAILGGVTTYGQVYTAILPLLAEVMITAWECKTVREGGRIVPRADPSLLDQVKVNDLIVIDNALRPLAVRLADRERLDDVDPPMPQPPSTD
jgi:hypothetical protein